MSKRTALIDLDAMLHIVANVQFSSGNRDNSAGVSNHICTFVKSIQENCKCTHALMFYQGIGHTNFRNELLPEYKGHRTTSEAIALWKPTILDTFKGLGAFELQSLESDDALSILAEKIGYNNVVLVSSDKDMKQVPGTHYNPFMTTNDQEARWKTFSIFEAERFFWEQVLMGDSTDMPNSMCGIPGVGPATASKLCDDDLLYADVIKNAYTKKFGAAEGYKRANLTYMMVRLLKLKFNSYISKAAQDEVECVLNALHTHEIPLTNSIDELFPQVVKVEPPSFFQKP